MTSWSGDQVRSDFNRANVIQIPRDPERRYRLVSSPARFICLSEDVVDCKETGHERDSSSQHNRF
jgi:hypothetical protein